MVAHDVGWSYDQLVNLYDDFRQQIQRACPGWSADRAACADGSAVFVGSQAEVLAIMPDRSMHVGRLGATAANHLLCFMGMSCTTSGTVQYPPPNPLAARLRLR